MVIYPGNTEVLLHREMNQLKTHVTVLFVQVLPTECSLLHMRCGGCSLHQCNITTVARAKGTAVLDTLSLTQCRWSSTTS